MIELVERLLYEEESATLDFKEEQYKFIEKDDYQKSELLKDILAFANAWRREDSYILIGVKEVKGGKSIVMGIDEDDKIDDASLQEFVNKKLNKPISFEYKNVSIDDKMIGVIKIPLENNKRPFFLKKDYAKLKKHEVKIRRGSSTDSADPDEVSKMSSDNIVSNQDPRLEIEFADNKNKIVLGKSIEYQSCKLSIKDVSTLDNISYSGLEDQLYFNRIIQYCENINYMKPISFCLSSDILSTDIKIVITTDADIDLMYENEIKKPTSSILDKWDTKQNNKLVKDIKIEKSTNKSYIEIVFKKVYAEDTIYCHDMIYIGCMGKIELNYTIYADNLSKPITGILKINSIVNNDKITFDELLKEYNENVFQKYQKLKREAEIMKYFKPIILKKKKKWH